MTAVSSVIAAIVRQFIAESVVRPAAKRLAATVTVYGIVAVLALSALAFFYVALDVLIAERLGGVWAAVILLAANLGIIVLILAWRTIARARRRAAPREAAADTPELALAVALARLADQKLRKGAPELALAALALGVIAGAAPEFVSMVRKRRRKRPKRDE